MHPQSASHTQEDPAIQIPAGPKDAGFARPGHVAALVTFVQQVSIETLFELPGLLAASTPMDGSGFAMLLITALLQRGLACRNKRRVHADTPSGM